MSLVAQNIKAGCKSVLQHAAAEEESAKTVESSSGKGLVVIFVFSSRTVVVVGGIQSEQQPQSNRRTKSRANTDKALDLSSSTPKVPKRDTFRTPETLPNLEFALHLQKTGKRIAASFKCRS